MALLAAAAWVWKGNLGAISLLLGGAAVAVPNAVLAFWLTIRVRRGVSPDLAILLLGELLKIGLTLALLVAAVASFRSQLAWLPLVIGVIGALKAQWLALWYTRSL